MAKPPIRIALIGTGMVAQTHLLAIRDAAPQARLQGVLARRADSTHRFRDSAAETLGCSPRAYGSVAEAAADPEVDMALILTPPNARMAVIAPLAEAGIPILLEKPVARSGAEARQVVDACAQAGVPLGIVFQHRMRAASLKAREMVRSGQLGALGLVEISVPWWREQSYYDEPGRGTYARDGGGVLISQAIHTIDLALSLTGPVTDVQAMAATTRFHQMEAEDMVSAGLRFANGAVGTLFAATASFPGAAETITLHFDKGSLHLGEGVLTVTWRNGQIDRFGATAGTGGGADPMAFTHEWHQSILEDFMTAIREDRPPCVPGSEALRSHDLIDAITRSAHEGHRVTLGDIA